MSVDTTVLEHTIIFDKLDEIHELCRTFNVQRLDLFGSALRDDFEPDRSDLDFLVEYKAMPPEDHADSFFGLWFGLQDLFGREVDLIERKTVKNPYIGQSIHATRVLVYDAT
jgi:predicted nucleotidyltransferase